MIATARGASLSFARIFSRPKRYRWRTTSPPLSSFPSASLSGLDREQKNPSVKLVANCETLLFQRPDEAINPGADWQAEADIASPGTFISNFEPLTVEQARALVDHVVEFDRYTDPMKRLLEGFADREAGTNGKAYVVSSSHPRMVNGKPSLNPRYLQKRPDLVAPRETYLAEIAARLEREIPAGKPVYFPVNAVLAGRRTVFPTRQAVCRRWPFTDRSIIRSCRSFSWS